MFPFVAVPPSYRQIFHLKTLDSFLWERSEEVRRIALIKTDCPHCAAKAANAQLIFELQERGTVHHG